MDSVFGGLSRPSNRYVLAAKFFYGLRTYALVVFIAYCAYVSIRADASNNWNHTRKLGFAEPNYCQSTGETYTVVMYNINTASQPVKKPIMVFSQRQELCFTTSYLASCKTAMSNLDTKDSVSSFTDLFDPQARNYYPYSTLFYVLGAVALTLTFLYDSEEDNDGDRGVDGHDGGAFAGNINKQQVIRATALIVLVMGAMCIVASVSQIYVHEEDCEDIYKATAGAKQYCQQINSCGMVLQSIITPTDGLAEQYPALMMMWGIILMLATFVRWVIKALDLINTLQFATHASDAAGPDRQLFVELNGTITTQVWRVISGAIRNQPTSSTQEQEEHALDQEIEAGRTVTAPPRTSAASRSAAAIRYMPSSATVVPVNDNATTTTTTTTTVITATITTTTTSTAAPGRRHSAFAASATSHRQHDRVRNFMCYQHLSADEVWKLSDAEECTVCLGNLKPTPAELERLVRGVDPERGGGGGGGEDNDDDDNYRQFSKKTQPAYHYKYKLQQVMRTDNRVQVVRTNACQHIFHQRCLEDWMHPPSRPAASPVQNSCPVCRSSLT